MIYVFMSILVAKIAKNDSYSILKNTTKKLEISFMYVRLVKQGKLQIQKLMHITFKFVFKNKKWVGTGPSMLSIQGTLRIFFRFNNLVNNKELYFMVVTLNDYQAGNTPFLYKVVYGENHYAVQYYFKHSSALNFWRGICLFFQANYFGSFSSRQ